MTPHERQLYRQEVEELTGLLHDDPDWHDLRAVLRDRQTRLSDTTLAAFMEDEDGMRYGVLITLAGRVIEFRCRVASSDRTEVSMWRDRTDDPAVLVEYPQVVVALEMREQ